MEVVRLVRRPWPAFGGDWELFFQNIMGCVVSREHMASEFCVPVSVVDGRLKLLSLLSV